MRHAASEANNGDFKYKLNMNFNFLACVEVNISSKKLHTKKQFQEKPCDHIHGIIYRLHLSKSIPNIIITDIMPRNLLIICINQ